MSSSDDFVPIDAEASPSAHPVFTAFAQVESGTADGKYRHVTVFDNGEPLATLIPFKKMIDPALLVAPADVAVQLSRFAYLRRDGNVMLLKTPLSGLDLQLHDPRAGALLVAMNFPLTPSALSAKVGVTLDAAQRFMGALIAMKAAVPIAETRDFRRFVQELMDFSVNQGLPRAWDSPVLRAALADVPWDESINEVQLIWELHHDGSKRADISLSVQSRTARDRRFIADFEFDEFDVTDSGLERMGTFFRMASMPAEADPCAWTRQALAAAGAHVDLPASHVIHDLANLLGPVRFIGVTPRRVGVRAIFDIPSIEQMTALAPILAQAGVPAATVSRLALLEPLVHSNHLVRLAVNITDSGIAPNIGFEVFVRAGETRWIPGVLDALGLETSAIDEVRTMLETDPVSRELFLSPGVLTDELRVSPLHVKIAFDEDAEVSAKTYLNVSNVALTVLGRTGEDRDVPATWEFHDLLFHSQVRNGRLRHRIGGTTRFSVMPDADFQPRPVPPGDIALPDIDVASVVAHDPPFGEVLRARESDRDWHGPEIPLASLAELLARTGEIIPREILLDDDVHAFSGAPYPSGGGIYETDIVVIAHRIEGLDPGAYLYRRESRSLAPLMGSTAERDSLLMFAAEATGNGVTRPQALLVMAARFPDLAVKYEGIAYALMVKHVGVLMATIANSATAMGLGAVPIGTGDSDAFAAATGLNYYRHGSTGEIAISQPS